MDLILTDEQRLIRDTAARFVADRYGLDRLRAVEAMADGFCPEHWAIYAELGWLGLAVPEVAGGLGGRPEDLALLLIELGRAPALEPFVGSAVICGSLLGLAGSDRGAEVLSEALSGKTRIAPVDGVGAGLGGTGRLRLRRSRGGFCIDGACRIVPDGASAPILLVAAEDDNGQPALVFVEAGQPRLGRRAYRLLDATGAADLTFDAVEPGTAALLAEGPVAARALRQAAALATLARLSESLGSIEAILALSAEYLRNREQFGRPIGKFQALQHMAASMFVEAQEARSALYHALAHWEDGEARRSEALATAAVVILDAARTVSRAGIQIHGGYGLTEEFAVGHHYRRQLVLEKLLGEPEVQLERISRGAAATEGTDHG